MPQEFHVLCCYKCNTFQVQQVKKVNKWNCKMCGEKQSIKKVYYKGKGADCRVTVQKMNLTKAQIAERNYGKNTEGDADDKNEYIQGNSVPDKDDNAVTSSDRNNKWGKYVEEDNEVNEESESDIPEESMYTWQRQPQGRKRKRQKENVSKLPEQTLCRNEVQSVSSKYVSNVPTHKSVISKSITENVLHKRSQSNNIPNPNNSKWGKFSNSSINLQDQDTDLEQLESNEVTQQVFNIQQKPQKVNLANITEQMFKKCSEPSPYVINQQELPESKVNITSNPSSCDTVKSGNFSGSHFQNRSYNSEDKPLKGTYESCSSTRWGKYLQSEEESEDEEDNFY